MRRPSSRPVRVVALATLVGAACQSTEGPTPSIGLSASPASLSVAQGSSGSFVATVSRSGGFAGSITIEVVDAPAGVTGVVSGTTTTASTTSATVTLTVARSVAPGSYTPTVRARGAGVADASTAVGLTVTQRPAIRVALEPAAVSIAAGGSAMVGVTIVRTNFTGDVSVALDGGTAGISGSFSGSPSDSSAMLHLQISPTAAVGELALTVRGSGSGVSPATALLALTVTHAPSFDILPVATDPTTVVQGTAASVAVALERTGGFATPVDLTVDSLPPGVTATFTPASVAGTTSALSLVAESNVPVGEYGVTIRGTAVGHSPKLRTFKLSVVAPPSFALSVTPSAAAAVQPGGPVVNRTIAINRSNFAGVVSLAVTANGGGAGLSANLSSASTDGNSVTLALSAVAQLVPATYAVTVTGTAPGIGDRSVTTNVEVRSSGTPITLDYSACYPHNVPVWLAYQDGAGPWQVVAPAGRVFRFAIRSAKGGLAWVWRPNLASPHWVNVEYYGTAEMARIRPEQLCTVFPSTKDVTATTRLPSGHTATVSLADATGVAGPVDSVARLSIARNGTFDLLGYAVDPAAIGSNDRIFLRRDVITTSIPFGGSVGFPIDFADSLYSFVPANATFSLAGPLAGAGRLTVSGSYRTAGCVWAPLQSFSRLTPGAFSFLGVPSVHQRPSDSHAVRVEVESASFATYRSVYQLFSTVAPRTITVPSELPVLSPTTLGGPYAALRFQFAVPNDLVLSVSLSYHDPTSGKFVIMYASKTWLGGKAVDLGMPLFSGLPGWDDQWVAPSGAIIDWSVTGGGNRHFMGGFDRDLGPCGVGSVFSSRQGRL